MMIGLYFSFINPRKFVVYSDSGKRIVFTGFQKFILIDLLFHIAVFCIVVYVYGRHRYGIATYVNVALVMLIYMGCVDLKRVYGVQFWEMFIVFIVTNILFFMFFLK